MMTTQSSRQRRRVRLIPLIGIPAAIMLFLWVTRANEVTLLQLALASSLLFIPWLAYLRWRDEGRPELPLFAIISVMYFLYYAVALFWGDLTITTTFAPLGQELSSPQLTQGVLMALLGVLSLWLGIRSRIGHAFQLRNLDFVALKPGRLNYVRFILVIGSLGGFADSNFMLGQGGRQAIIIFLTTVPLLAFAILFRNFLQGTATSLDKALIAGFLGMRFLSGMSSGWLGVFTAILIICASLYIAERKRIPRLAFVLVVCFTLFFQVGKDDFRKAYWRGEEAPAGRVERLQYWIEASASKWSDAAADPSGATVRDAIAPSINRLSLLTQSANVIEQTPSVVPYQYGQLYSYMFVTLIPRFIWPDKPSVNDANQYYQVAYGLTREENLEGVSISVGVLTEGYINFGWPGALGIMFLLGIFFDFFQSTFLSRHSGQLLTSLGIVLLPQLLGIESQLAQYLSGIVQQVVFTLIIMLPAMSLQRKASALSVRPFRYQVGNS